MDQDVPASSKVPVDVAYASEPWWYDLRGFGILTFAYRSTLPKQIRFFSDNIKSPHLEVAIGSGTLFGMILFWRKLKGLSLGQVTGFDYAEHMLAGARQRFAHVPELTLVKADAAHLPFAADSFQSVNIANAIHCLPEIQASIQEIYRVMRPGASFAGNCLLYPQSRGGLLSSTWNAIAGAINNWGIKKGILFRPYQAQEVRDLLLQAGFEIQFDRVRGNCFEFIALKKGS